MTDELPTPALAPEHARLARQLTIGALVLGLAFDAGLGSRVALDSLEARRVAARIETLEASRAALETDLVRLTALEQRRDRLRQREEQLHAIAASRLLWAPKLARLAEIYATTPAGRVDRITLSRTGTDEPSLAIDFIQRGVSLRAVADLRERLVQDPVFFADFDRLESPRVLVQQPGVTPEPGPITSFRATFVRRHP